MSTKTKKSKPTCDYKGCRKTVNLSKRKGYKELLCPEHMFEIVKKEIIDHIDDPNYSFVNLFNWNRGGFTGHISVHDNIWYEDDDIAAIKDKLIAKLDHDAIGEMWWLIRYRKWCGGTGNCSVCGERYHTGVYRLNSIGIRLCDQCLQDLDEEMKKVVEIAKEDRRERFLEEIISWIGRGGARSVGSLIEKRYSCAEDKEEVKRYLAKLINEGKVPQNIVRIMEKSNYYVREIQPIINELKKDAED